mmetsp:Transcript_14809/g.26869  ORF Transcript_14809/g.26869 Transcript_14809/m.26869 type:complete len:98 (-) Transcript_14809:392-685(-)
MNEAPTAYHNSCHILEDNMFLVRKAKTLQLIFLILFEEDIKAHVGHDVGEVSLVTGESHQESSKAGGNHHHTILLVAHIKDTPVHDVVVVIGQSRFG